MGHGNAEGTSHEVMTTHIQRNPTIPMTKRDSLVSNGTRVSLLANGSTSTTPKVFGEKDYVNTNPNMVAGKKRSPQLAAKVKRTASYKVATNRQSVDDLDGLAAISTSTDAKSELRDIRSVDRTKYNTLPRTETALPQKKQTEPRRRKREKSDIERTASQKSGTYPSPDTDEDQRYIQPERIKKSRFKRIKEQLINKFKKDGDHQRDKGEKKKGGKQKSPRSRVKPKHPAGRDAFNTPNDDIEMLADNNNGQNVSTDNHKASDTHGRLSIKRDSSQPQSNKGPGLLKTIRNSFRRKQAPAKYLGKGSTDPSVKPQGATSSSQPRSSSSLEQDPASVNISRRSTSKPIDIVDRIEEEFMQADDSITEIFGSLIDPGDRSPITYPHTLRTQSRPDTSRLRLEGLTKFKPRSFGRSSPKSERPRYQGAYGGDLSPTVEIDGLDFADAPTSGVTDESDVSFADVSQHEQQCRIGDVAERLKAIGDSIANRIESESAGSSDEIAGFRIGSQNRRRSELELELLQELRAFGDDFDKSRTARANSVSLPTIVIPIIRNIIRAQDYSVFKTVIQREISNTVGWEQVAWYTYIIKATMDLAGAGKTVGRVVKNNATRYFSSTLRPWIQSQPNGWESIHEETDTECEVD